MDPLPVALEEVGFRWPGQADPLLQGFTLRVEPGTITAVVGASGCGKSTLLRLAAGLLLPDSGRIRPGRMDRQGVAFAFQRPNLLPWRSVASNVALPLELCGVQGKEREARVAAALALVELEQAAALLPGALSGGMQMRASLARAWVVRPRLLLMDEPFAALDALTRQRMHAAFQGLWQDGRPTVVLVTHDIDEAVLLADRVVAVGGRPLRMVGEVAVGLARPRPTTLRHDPRLGALVGRIEDWL